MKHTIQTNGLTDVQTALLIDATARRGATALSFDDDLAIFESDRWDSYSEFANAMVMYMDGLTDALSAIGREK
jgi:hypothetical protein